MSFFSKKKEVDLESICRIFYENVILNCEVDGADINAKIFDTLRNCLIAEDQNFAGVDPQKFNTEIIILQFELFALAWLYQFGDKSAIAQSIFTKNYLHEKGEDDIWDGMEKYNNAISRSAFVGLSESEQAYFLKNRADSADQHIADAEKSGTAMDESMGRPINRLFSEKAWKKGITAGFILFALCNRLGFDENFEPSKEAHSRWFIEINDMFKKSQESLGKIKIRS